MTVDGRDMGGMQDPCIIRLVSVEDRWSAYSGDNAHGSLTPEKEIWAKNILYVDSMIRSYQQAWRPVKSSHTRDMPNLL